MKRIILLSLICLTLACKKEPSAVIEKVVWQPYDETTELTEQKEHELARMRFKLLNSKVLDKNELWQPFEKELSGFETRYEELKPYILEQNIPSIQQSVSEGVFSYEELTLFYLYRIRKFESDNEKSLNALISINPDVLKQARSYERQKAEDVKYSLYGIPILLKDNIGTSGMATTAGAYALKDNYAEDAFITARLKEEGAIILGKLNLSEWAYYFCNGCPLGYSAMGGQTLNPYGRKQFETGGSSSGSGVAVAANYAVAAIGTETSGSILSPSSQNSVVGLKPTIGLLSRTGIVPISGTLDTPGPMTKSVIDNAILLQAMTGKDPSDPASVANDMQYTEGFANASLEGKRFGVLTPLLKDTLYLSAIEKIKAKGAEVIEFEPEEVDLDGFLTLLNIDMKHDLPAYMAAHAKTSSKYNSVDELVSFNLKDSVLRMPYGQGVFDRITMDSTTLEQLEIIKERLMKNGRHFFDTMMNAHHLDAVLSINNYHASFAAVAQYPCLTVPMGYKSSGEPANLTFIGKPFSENSLLSIGFAFEKSTRARKIPPSYN
ncbi:amidase family protein [Ascidiimonas aurantiaca]|uniref:amidase family protein n=1 Tax=Ascidiimonas aurantiaca TaxID=1685432 RepID=UPI0030EC4EC6